MIGIVAVLFPVRIIAAIDRVLVRVLTDIGTRIIRPTLRLTGLAVTQTAKRLVPHAAGRLAESLDIGELTGHGTSPQPFLGNKSQIRISHRSIPSRYGRDPMNYALWMHQGHVIVAPVDRDRKRWRPGRPAGGTVVGHVEGVPYLRRAADIASPVMQAIVTQLTRRHLGSIARGNLIHLTVSQRGFQNIRGQGPLSIKGVLENRGGRQTG